MALHFKFLHRGSERSHRARFFSSLVAIAATLALLGVTSPAASAKTYPFSGSVAGCTWEVSADTETNKLSGTITCPAEDIANLSLTAEATCKPSTIDSGGVLSLGAISFKADELSYERTPEVSFEVPVCPSTVGEKVEELEKLKKELKEVAQEFVSDSETQAVLYLLEQAPGLPASVQKHIEGLKEAQHEFCAEINANGGMTETKPAPWCDGGSDIGWFCKLSEGCTENYSVNEEGITGSVNSSSSAEAAQKQLCPEVNSMQSETIYVCIPAFVQGDWNAGKRSIVLLPGGALIAFPVGGDLAHLEAGPTISSEKSIVSLGGMLGGWNVTLKAPKIEIAGSVFGMINDLELSGKTVWLGKVDIEEALGSLWEPISQLIKILPPEVLHLVPQSGTVTVPAIAAAARVSVNAEEEFLLGSGSTLSLGGRGGRGGTPVWAEGGLTEGEAPGGAKEDYGGSHGGYGGYGIEPQEWGLWQEINGRGKTFDSPFAPSEPGAGGSGNDSDNVIFGGNGGGVVKIAAPKATVHIDGKIDVSGADSGATPEQNAYGGPEGAGAGGSVYVTAKTLAGSGEVDAAGGGYPSENVNSEGGMGGGGRIAAIFAADSGWSGSLDAHGGVDQQPEVGEGSFTGTGGAGTVFTRQVVFGSKGEIKEGVGAYPEGTLTIDGGQSPGVYPPPDGTPIEESWGGTKRKLVLTGEARGYATHIHFGAIEVLDGSDLTGELTPNGEPQPERLEVQATTLEVDASSRIDMSARGYAGGQAGELYDESPLADAGETAPGQEPAVNDYGGSHGGAGGARSGYLDEEGDRPASTYDDPLNPSLPGGGGAGEWDTGTGNPGGGVLDVTAGTLELDGTISADGEGGQGPTATDPTPFNFEGAAGAGGSVLARVEHLTGNGSIHADGGVSCVETSPPLLPSYFGCSSGEGGGGGGGRVAVYATSCGWTGSISAKGGINQAYASEPEDAAQTSGQEGSVYFSAGAGSCTSESHEGGGGGSSENQTPAGTSSEEGTSGGSESGASEVAGVTSSGGTVVVVLHGGSLPVKGSVVQLALRCTGSGQCIGKGTLAVLLPQGHHASHSRRHRRHSKLIVIGHYRFSVPGGHSGQVKIRLDSAGKKLLRKSHNKLRARLTVAGTASGKPVKLRKNVLLEARKKKKHKKHRG